jgi:hypothetical protein
MIHYRNTVGYDKKTSPQHTKKTPVREGSIIAECVGPLIKHRDLSTTKSEFSTPEATGGLQERQLTLSWRAADPGADRSSNTTLIGYCALKSCQRGGDMLTRKVLSKTLSNLVKHEYKEDQVEVKMRILAAKAATFYQIGDGVDPFVMLPQFKSHELDIMFLTRNCKWSSRTTFRVRLLVLS